MQRGARQRCRLALDIGAPAARTLFQPDQAEHTDYQQRGQLGSSRQGEERKPCLVNGGRKGIEVEHRYRAEIRQGFHQCQRQAADDPRPGHGQRHPPESLPGRQAERGGGFQCPPSLGGEGIAGEQVDVRI